MLDAVVILNIAKDEVYFIFHYRSTMYGKKNDGSVTMIQICLVRGQYGIHKTLGIWL